MLSDSGEVPADGDKTSAENSKKRKLKTPIQVMALENFYNEHKYPSEEMKGKLAEEIGLTEKQVSGWFCHRRLKDKRSVKEDGNTIGSQDRSSVVLQDRGSALRQDSCGSTKQTDYWNPKPREVESQRLYGGSDMGNADGEDTTSSERSSSLQKNLVSSKDGLRDVEDLRENQAYLNVARSQARLATDINLLTARYDSRAKRLSGERDKAYEGLRVSGDNFEKMTKALDAKNSEIATLAKELNRAGDAVKKADQEKAELQRRFEVDKEGYELRLKNQEEEHQKSKEIWEERRLAYGREIGRGIANQVRAEVRAAYEARLRRIAEHMAGRAKADLVVAQFAQVSGTIDVLNLIAEEDKIQIPAGRMENLIKDRDALKAQALGMEVPDLWDGDVEELAPAEDAGVSGMDVDFETLGDLAASPRVQDALNGAHEDPLPE